MLIKQKYLAEKFCVFRVTNFVPHMGLYYLHCSLVLWFSVNSRVVFSLGFILVSSPIWKDNTSLQAVFFWLYIMISYLKTLICYNYFSWLILKISIIPMKIHLWYWVEIEKKPKFSMYILKDCQSIINKKEDDIIFCKTFTVRAHLDITL